LAGIGVGHDNRWPEAAKRDVAKKRDAFATIIPARGTPIQELSYFRFLEWLAAYSRNTCPIRHRRWPRCTRRRADSGSAWQSFDMLYFSHPGYSFGPVFEENAKALLVREFAFPGSWWSQQPPVAKSGCARSTFG
jgi:hypothetical protein